MESRGQQKKRLDKKEEEERQKGEQRKGKIGMKRKNRKIKVSR